MQGVSREDFIAGVARDIQSKIPPRFDLPLLKKEIGVPSPTQVVLIQELERWNNVLVVSAAKYGGVDHWKCVCGGEGKRRRGMPVVLARCSCPSCTPVEKICWSPRMAQQNLSNAPSIA